MINAVSLETGIPRGALYALIRRGAIPVVELPTNKCLYIRRDDLEALITSRPAGGAR